MDRGQCSDGRIFPSFQTPFLSHLDNDSSVVYELLLRICADDTKQGQKSAKITDNSVGNSTFLSRNVHMGMPYGILPRRTYPGLDGICRSDDSVFHSARRNGRSICFIISSTVQSGAFDRITILHCITNNASNVYR